MCCSRALALLGDLKATAMIVGAGPDEAEFKGLAERLGLGDRVTFPGAMPALSAFPKGRILIVPSRAESFPYVVLEAGAAGLPLVATNVGGHSRDGGGDEQRARATRRCHGTRKGHARQVAGPQRAADDAAALKRKVSETFTGARHDRSGSGLLQDRLSGYRTA